MADFERIRLVILGGAGVGKSCIVKRFLFKTYSDKYRATVEDLYNREYDLGSVTLKVNVVFNLNILFIDNTIVFQTVFDYCYCVCEEKQRSINDSTRQSYRLFFTTFSN